ncbi:MauE/DoxX family redox-associated membrane protein [Congregibacter litoralis]|uniref:Methylamine utilization protein MauE n=1 Tax=Congregibacter litoralis KT71 TaxID=314285 RepID=A4A7G2_9GAMM|nr:MauE/DoxX family redox-associated membrane protein [Congregibacter litoralis]EAQ98231.2 Methylamine utilization protein MauE [Congregibacter litoralis KT71]
MIDPLLELTLALSLFLLFVSAGQHKRWEARRFQAQLDAYKLLPASLSPIVAKSLPLLELAVALALLVPLSRSAAAFAAMMLLVMYALAVLLNLVRGRRDIDCGCGGTPQPLSYWLVFRNIMLAAGALIVMLPTTERALGAMDVGTMIFLTTLLGLCYLTIDQLLQNQSALTGWKPHEH